MKTSYVPSIMLLVLVLVAFVKVDFLSPEVHARVLQQVDVQKYVEFTEQIKTQTENLREQARGRGIDVAVANRMISEGKVLLDAAKTSLQKADYPSAFQKAREAQMMFRDAAVNLAAVGDNGEETKEDILVAIDRSAEEIRRIQNAIVGITESAENQNLLNSLKRNLRDAEKNLAEAKTAIESKSANVSKASESLEDADKDIAEAFNALESISDWILNQRSDAFLQNMKKRLDKIKDQVDSAERKGSKIDDLRARLPRAEKSVQDAKAKFLAGDKEAALDEIKKARDTLKDIEEELTERERD